MNVLILLIGGNPLPNYVVAKYLLDSGRDDTEKLPAPDKVMLVYSERTERFALKIIAQLHINEKAEKVNLQKGERQPEIISEKIQKKLDKLAVKTPIETLHLNYTGGTKSMSVRGYIAITEWLEKTNNEHMPLIISDLDPDNHKIVLKDSTDCYPTGNRNLFDKIQLTSSDILDLHGIQVDDPGIEVPIVPEEKLNTFISYALKEYKEKKGNERVLFNILNRIGVNGSTNQEKEECLEKRIDKFNDAVSKIEQIFPGLFNHFCDNDALKYPKLSFYNFMQRNAWLEHFVFKSRAKCKEDHLVKLYEIRLGVEVSYDGRPSEMDVIAIRGYQLFLISCTTDQSVKKVKEKAFEALYRAEELGGEHAKVIIISMLPERADREKQNRSLKELCKDLQQFRAGRNCYLIGIDVLEEETEGKGALTQRLKEIISGERKWELWKC